MQQEQQLNLIWFHTEDVRADGLWRRRIRLPNGKLKFMAELLMNVWWTVMMNVIVIVMLFQLLIYITLYGMNVMPQNKF